VRHYEFTCGGGHNHGPFTSLAEAQAARRDLKQDEECAGDAGTIRSYEPLICRIPVPSPGCVDIPAHYNESLGQVVKGGRHLREIQKKEGCQDYEPVRDASPVVDWRKKKRRLA
jgi:hypothetical protein